MAGAAVESGMVGVQEESGKVGRWEGWKVGRLVLLDESFGFFLRLGAKGFEGPVLEMVDKLRRLLAMQLGCIELAKIEDLGDTVEGGVYEYPDKTG
jgi:hypothetical protein